MKARAPRGEVLCAICLKFLPRRVSVVINGKAMHPVGCFTVFLQSKRAQIDLALTRAEREGRS